MKSTQHDVSFHFPEIVIEVLPVLRSAQVINSPDNMNCSDETAHSIRGQIRNCLTLLSKYQWLHDSLVHDFFVDNHWSNLPLSWQIVLAEMSQEELANFLSGQSNSGRNKKNSKKHLL